MEPALTLRPYQQTAQGLLANSPRFALYWHPRTGKTATILTHIASLFAQQAVKRVFIVAPSSALTDWPREFRKWCPHIPFYELMRDSFETFQQRGGIFITSYARLTLGRPIGNKIHFSEIANVDAVVFDESHLLKNYCMRTKWALRASQTAPFLYLMTGTPTGGYDKDFFYQMLLLDPTCWGTTSMNAFMAKFFGVPPAKQTYLSAARYRKVSRNIEEFEAIIKFYCSTLKLSDVQGRDLGVDHHIVEFDMTEEQKEMITTLEQDFLLELKSGTITAINAMSEIIKSSQILSGHCKLSSEEDKSIILKSSPKKDWVKANIQDIIRKKGKVVLWCVFKNDYSELGKVLTELGIGYVTLRGGLTPKKRKLIIESFRANPHIKVFMSHPASGGMGLDLSIANTNIIYNRDYNMVQQKQAQARIVTVATEQITQYDLVFKDSIDMLVFDALEKKKKNLNAAMSLSSLLQEWRKQIGKV